MMKAYDIAWQYVPKEINLREHVQKIFTKE